MKKVLNYILLTAVLGTFLPYSVLAETTNVGVNITGSVSIDVVTTISANITLDLTTGETTPTYMEIKNNSSVPVSAKITNISTTSEGAPSTFVDFMEKDWYNLSKEETSTYVNFSILGEGQNVTAQNILPNTEIDLGVLRSFVDSYGGGYACAEYPCYVAESNLNSQLFQINANFGMNWDEGDKSFTYQITTVYSQADKYVEPTYTLPDSIESAQTLSLSGINNTAETEGQVHNDPSKTYLMLMLQSNDFDRNLINEDLSQMNIRVDGESATNLGFVGMGADIETGMTLIGVSYSFSALESSPEGTVHYLNIDVNIGEQTYRFIEKVFAYSE